MTTIKKVTVTLIDHGTHFALERRIEDAKGSEVELRGPDDLRKLGVPDLYMLSVAEAGRQGMSDVMDLTEQVNKLAAKMQAEGASQSEIASKIKSMAPKGMFAAAYTEDDGKAVPLDADVVPSILH